MSQEVINKMLEMYTKMPLLSDIFFGWWEHYPEMTFEEYLSQEHLSS